MLGYAGSVAAYSLAINALVVGWSYRMLEQFCLDGCVPMHLVERITPAGTGATRTAMAAVVSPTCWLHLTTGATLPPSAPLPGGRPSAPSRPSPVGSGALRRGGT